jgi:hypothetical protein
MKTLLLALAIFSSSFAFAQKGKIYGSRPSTGEVIEAHNLDAFMGTKPRVSTSIRGVIVKVTKTKGGWFEISAGHGKVIAAHFSKYDVTILTNLVGHIIIAEGIAARQFMADDSQHLAGQKSQHAANSKELTFEVTGLMVEK